MRSIPDLRGLMVTTMLALLVGVPAMRCEAHPLAPALLEVHQMAPSGYRLEWRQSVLSAPGVPLVPVLPEDCRVLAPTATVVAGVRIEQALAQCAQHLVGRRLMIDGLQDASINVIVRYVPLDGVPDLQLLDAGRPAFIVPASRTRPGGLSIFGDYLGLGIEHLLLGFDHLLFVLGLMLLVPPGRRLLWTVTAFTVGHSITLSAAAMGGLRLNATIVEWLIAASIVWLAVEALRPSPRQGWLARWPWGMAAAFGLLHGLGFAGALAEIGLPQGAVLPALLAFNLDVEIGQLLVIAGVLLSGWLWRARYRGECIRPWTGWRTTVAYGIGSVAALWCFERAQGWMS